MSSFDDASRTAAHVACTEAAHALIRPCKETSHEFAVARTQVEIDGCHVTLTIIAEWSDL